MSRSAAAASRRRRLDSAAGCTYDDASARPSGPSAASAPATARSVPKVTAVIDEDLGPIDLERTRERLDPGRRQVGERHRVTVDEHALGIDRSMRDARVMERTQGTPHRLTEPVVHLWAELGERPTDATNHEEGVTDRIGTGCHDRVNLQLLDVPRATSGMPRAPPAAASSRRGSARRRGTR